jgi:hypothetical protein
MKAQEFIKYLQEIGAEFRKPSLLVPKPETKFPRKQREYKGGGNVGGSILDLMSGGAA